MNTINVVKKKTKHEDYNLGDIFMYNNTYYILAQVAKDSFCLVSLAEGNRYRNYSNNIEDAVAGSTYLGSNMTITLE